MNPNRINALPNLAMAIACGVFAFGCVKAADSENPDVTSTRAVGSLLAEDGSFRIYTRGLEPGKLEMIFENAPASFHALEMKPSKREAKLDRGTWLVLSFNVCSVPDVRCILLAARASDKLGRIMVGIRPYGRVEEFKNWYADYEDTFESPIWLMISDGRVMAEAKGALTESQLIDFVRKRP